MNICHLVVLIFITFPLFAQPKEIKDFENSFCKEYWKAADIDLDFDKRANLMSKFESKIERFIKKHPETINYPLKKNGECINISTSEDKLLRVYSWNVQAGGTARMFSTIIQFKSNNKTYTLAPKEEDNNNLHYDIHSIKLGNKTYYLVKTLAIGSSRIHAMRLEAFIIQGTQLKPIDDLFVSNSQSTGLIEFEYDNASVQYTIRTLDLISFEPKSKNLHVAVVDENGKVSNKNIVYKVKGNKFVFTGFEKAK